MAVMPERPRHMRPIGALPLRVAATALLLSALGTAQGGPPPAPDPLLDDQLDLIEEALRNRKGEDDPKAVGILSDIKRLAEAGMHEDDVKKVAKALSKVFRVPRPYDDPRLYVAAAEVLGHCGPGGAKVLASAYNDKRRFPNKSEWDGLRATLLAELGRTKDPRQVELLLDEALAAPREALMAAAGEALRHFGELPIKRRQDVVDRLVNRYESLDSEASNPVINRPGEPQNFGPQNAARILRAIQAPWNSTLAALTGQSFRTVQDWRRWLNNDGKKASNWA